MDVIAQINTDETYPPAAIGLFCRQNTVWARAARAARAGDKRFAPYNSRQTSG